MPTFGELIASGKDEVAAILRGRFGDRITEQDISSFQDYFEQVVSRSSKALLNPLAPTELVPYAEAQRMIAQTKPAKPDDFLGRSAQADPVYARQVLVNAALSRASERWKEAGWVEPKPEPPRRRPIGIIPGSTSRTSVKIRPRVHVASTLNGAPSACHEPSAPCVRKQAVSAAAPMPVIHGADRAYASWVNAQALQGYRNAWDALGTWSAEKGVGDIMHALTGETHLPFASLSAEEARAAFLDAFEKAKDMGFALPGANLQTASRRGKNFSSVFARAYDAHPALAAQAQGR